MVNGKSGAYKLTCRLTHSHHSRFLQAADAMLERACRCESRVAAADDRFREQRLRELWESIKAGYDLQIQRWPVAESDRGNARFFGLDKPAGLIRCFSRSERGAVKSNSLLSSIQAQDLPVNGGQVEAAFGGTDCPHTARACPPKRTHPSVPRHVQNTLRKSLTVNCKSIMVSVWIVKRYSANALGACR